MVTIRLWDVITGTYKRTFTGYTKAVTSVAFSPDGRYNRNWKWGWHSTVVGCGTTGVHKRTFTGHTGSGALVSRLAPDGGTLASGSWDGTVLLWEVPP